MKLGATEILQIYLAVMNTAGVFIMKADKERAKRGAYRIPEKTLFLVSILGGSLGTWAGMYIFRHKTKHWYFVLGMPLIFMAHVALLCFVIVPML